MLLSNTVFINFGNIVTEMYALVVRHVHVWSTSQLVLNIELFYVVV